jgi:uncharacterized membrane protein
MLSRIWTSLAFLPKTAEKVPKIKQQNDSNKKESTVEKIKKYHEMFSEGLISEEDFNTIKKQILEDKNGR